MRPSIVSVDLVARLELDEREVRLLNHITSYDISEMVRSATASSHLPISREEMSELFDRIRASTGSILTAAGEMRKANCGQELKELHYPFSESPHKVNPQGRPVCTKRNSMPLSGVTDGPCDREEGDCHEGPCTFGPKDTDEGNGRDSDDKLS